MLLQLSRRRPATLLLAHHAPRTLLKTIALCLYLALFITLSIPTAASSGAKQVATAASIDVSRFPRDPRMPSLLLPNEQQYALLTRPGRSYNVVVLLTASPSSGAECGAACLIAESLVTSAKYSYDAAKASVSEVTPTIHFAVLDFLTSKSLMQKLKITHLPQILIWPATLGLHKGKEPKAGASYHKFTDLQKGPENLLKYLNSVTGANIAHVTPVDYTRVAQLAACVATLVAAVGFFWRVLYFVIASRVLWALLATGFMILMNGGYMWVNIRHAPFSQHGGDGKESFVMAGMQTQLGAEIYSTAAATAAGILAGAVFIFWVPRLSTSSASSTPGTSSALKSNKRGRNAAAASAAAAAPAKGHQMQGETLQTIVAGVCILVLVYSFSAVARLFSLKMDYPYRMFL